MPTEAVAPDTFCNDVVENPPSIISPDSPPAIVVPIAEPIVADSHEDIDNGEIDKRVWHKCELIVDFLEGDAANRKKNTKIFRAQFAAGCYVKFANKLSTEGKWDSRIDMVKSRDLRCKFSKTGKYAGESAACKKIAEVKR